MFRSQNLLPFVLLCFILLLFVQSEEPSCVSTTTTLVVGATGATGRHVVQQLLDQGQNVKVIARSKQRMLEALKKNDYGDRLVITEASLLDLTDEQLTDQVKDVHAVISCLGHTLDRKGIWGEPRRLVTDAAKRLTEAMRKNSKGEKKKFILMGSDGVQNPAGTDAIRKWYERAIIVLLRQFIPPHVDNEQAAAFVHSLGRKEDLEWIVVRPTDLIDGEDTKYDLFDKPVGSLFGGGVATRANVAKCMVDLILEEKKWNEWKFQMPILHDVVKTNP